MGRESDENTQVGLAVVIAIGLFNSVLISLMVLRLFGVIKPGDGM